MQEARAAGSGGIAAFAASVALVSAGGTDVREPGARSAEASASAGLPGRAGRLHGRRVPILMYHAIRPPIEGAAYPELFVPRARFAAQMNWLDRHGYRAVTLGRVFDHWRGGDALPRRPVVVSFDDGYRSQYANAFPVLQAHGWPGVLNVEVRNERESWGLQPRLLRRLADAGWEIDAHTVNHPDLTTLSATRLRYEVAGARTIIRRQLHVPVAFFCYPSGRYDDRVVRAVRAAGYLGAMTTRYGLADPSEPYTLKRVRVNGSDDVRRFASKLTSLRG